MRFTREKGKQVLDMRGDLLLSKNGSFQSVGKSIAPDSIRGARYVENLREMPFRGKVKATVWALAHIWGSK